MYVIIDMCQVLNGARMLTLLVGASKRDHDVALRWSLDCVSCLPEPTPLQLV